MEEKEYLLSKSVKEIARSNDRPRVDADNDSGVFCNSNDFQGPILANFFI